MLKKQIKVKVCGMTDAAQAKQLVAMGVDAIGMILYADSPRQIDIKQAEQIRAVVPAFVSLVGVVVDCPESTMKQMVEQIGLDLIQLHGNETATQAELLGSPYIKAIRARDAKQVDAKVERYPGARAILLDPYVKGIHGGTGKQLDVSLWPKKCSKELILAGGLSANNVASMAAEFQPYAVDLNSGVESSPPIKDMTQIEKVLRILGR